MKKIVILLFLFLSLLMVGCNLDKGVLTNANSVIDPELVNVKYNIILVWSALEKIQAR